MGNTNPRSRSFASLLLAGWLLTLALPAACADNGASAICDEKIFQRRGMRICFLGSASGGTLTLTLMGQVGEGGFITTSPGESGELVAARFADMFNRCYAFTSRNCSAEPLGPTVYVSPMEFVMAGTETGVGAHPVVGSVSAVCRPDAEELCVAWDPGPDDDYSLIFVSSVGTYTRDVSSAGTYPRTVYPGQGNSCVIHRNPGGIWIGPTLPGHQDVRLMIYSRCGPSNAASIHLTGSRQEELDAYPFLAGVTPNWVPWSCRGSSAKAVALAEGNKIYAPGNGDFYSQGDPDMVKAKQGARPYPYYIDAADKPRYQSIKTPVGPSGPAGVYRRFLGLEPRHVYRVLSRLNTFGTDPGKGNWFPDPCSLFPNPASTGAFPPFGRTRRFRRRR